MSVSNNLKAVEVKPEPAKLSIIAETSKVVLYHFSMKNFKYLPEDIKVGPSHSRKLSLTLQRTRQTMTQLTFRQFGAKEKPGITSRQRFTKRQLLNNTTLEAFFLTKTTN